MCSTTLLHPALLVITNTHVIHVLGIVGVVGVHFYRGFQERDCCENYLLKRAIVKRLPGEVF